MSRLLVFARAPRTGEVKRRLAAEIGADRALAFYRTTLFELVARVGRDSRWHACLLVTPDESADERDLWPAGIERRTQGEGDLGQRMRRALETAPAGPVALIGSDIPRIAPAHVARAFDVLARRDLVFGPAEDGGFWLVGAARRRALPAALFQDVRWSSEHALADTLTPLSSSTIGLIDRLEDVDEGRAYRRWQRSGAHR